jgi:hypothetical protein
MTKTEQLILAYIRSKNATGELAVVPDHTWDKDFPRFLKRLSEAKLIIWCPWDGKEGGWAVPEYVTVDTSPTSFPETRSPRFKRQ